MREGGRRVSEGGGHMITELNLTLHFLHPPLFLSLFLLFFFFFFEMPI